MNKNVDDQLNKMRERLAKLEKRVAETRRKNETKVKCGIATALLRKIKFDELTKTFDQTSQCERFVDYIDKKLLVKIVVTQDWTADAKKYIDGEEKSFGELIDQNDE